MVSATASKYFSSIQKGFDLEMKELKDSDKFKAMSQKQQEKAIEALEDKQKSAKETAWKQQQALAAGQIVMDTASAIINSLTAKPAWAGVALAVTAGLMGVAQLAIVKNQKMPSFQEGGLLGGPAHNQGGILMEAEGGEFIVRKKAVDKLGLPFLRTINKFQSGGVVPLESPQTVEASPSININLSISGNLLSSDYVEGELAEQISESVRRGVDFGLNN